MPPIPGPIPRAAIAFFAAKGIRPSFNYIEVWAEEHGTAFTVAKILEAAILQEVQESLARALEDGVPFEQWRREMKQMFDKSGWTGFGGDRTEKHRMKIIYQTNMRSARAVGQWERIEKTRKVQPYLIYGLGPSARHRPVHESWNGLILPVTHPFWDEAFPPNGYGCKCNVMQASQRRADSLGGITRAPRRETELWEHPIKGALRVRKGIQPGFDYNPGKQHLREKKIREELNDARRELRNAKRRTERKLKR
jgi:SPP1 gp7 family putative phage head morphogenesis protein